MLTEKLFEDILVKYPDLIEKDLNVIGRQVTHFGKRIDILFEDRFKEKLIVELKINTLSREAIGQIMEYTGHILSEKDPSARAMLIANRIPVSIKKALDYHGVEYKEISLKYLLEFLENKDKQLFEDVMKPENHQKSVFLTKNNLFEPLRSNLGDTENFNEKYSVFEILGAVRDVRSHKNAKERLEIHFGKNSESGFPYGYTDKDGIPIRIIINGQVYSIGFHKTENNNYLWLSSTLARDGYQLADVLKRLGISKNSKIKIKLVEKDTYELTPVMQ